MLIRNLLSLFSTNNGLTERQEAMLAPVETAKENTAEPTLLCTFSGEVTKGQVPLTPDSCTRTHCR